VPRAKNIILFKRTPKIKKLSTLFILISATTIATVLEMNFFPETGEANGSQIMNNESESYSAETVTNLSPHFSQSSKRGV